MAELMPYLELRDPSTGACWPLVDNCRTVARLESILGANKVVDCECCPECDNQDYTGDLITDGTWWGSDGNPAAEQFYGFLASEVWLEPSASIRRRGASTAERPDYQPRQLIVRGRLLGRGVDGTYYGEQAFLDLLQGGCGPCDGWEATMRLFCPEYDPELFPVVSQWVPDDPPPLVGDLEECDPCGHQDPTWEPNLLGPSPEIPRFNADDGSRSVMRLRFVAMDEDPDVELPTPYCMGADVQIIFEVLDDWEWGNPVDVCSIDRGWDQMHDPTNPDDLTEPRCRPHDWKTCLTIPRLAECLDEDQLDLFAPPSVDSVVESPRVARQARARYCQPLYSTSRACLTPPVPLATDVALEFSIWSGETDLRNFRLDMWPAFENAPSPETCEGAGIYNRMVPCGQLLVPYVPARSWLVVDGRRGEVWLHCDGREGEKQEKLVEGWSHPTFDPLCRMWIMGTADCLWTDEGVAVEVSYFPRWRT